MDPCGVNAGPRGIDVLDSDALRSQIWLAEKATDGQSFRFRNYETGLLLTGDYQKSEMGRVVTTRRYTDGQMWDVIPLGDLTSGPMYRIKNVAMSTILGQSGTADSRCKILLNTPDSQQSEGWLIQPVILPTLYSITNTSHKLTLRAPSHPNPSDGVGGAVKLLVLPEQLTRDYLWVLEYVSLSEAVIRSASYQRFVLDLASDSQTVLAHEYHGGPSQCWTVERESEEALSLVNTKTGTLLAIRQREVSKSRRLNRLIAVPDGSAEWQIRSYPQPPLFWVTIQDQSGARIAQVDDEPLMLCEGPLNANDYSAQWRFRTVGDGLEYVIENRATGFMFGANATADRNDAKFHWILSRTESGSVHLPAEYKSYDPTSRVYYQKCDWHLKPAYDSIPSFAIVNSYTGRCVTNDPTANIGTVSTTNNVNDIRSQWHFHAQRAYRAVNDLTWFLSNKISENSLKVCLKEAIRVEAYNDNLQNSAIDTSSTWRLLPLSTHLLTLCMDFGPGFLYDPGSNNSQAQDPPEDIQSLYWYLVSHRESGFDFISLVFSTTEQMVEHINSKPSETPWDAIQRYLCAEKGPIAGLDSILKRIPLVGDLPLTPNATVRVAFAFLIARWTEDSIPKTSAPHTIISATRGEIEKQWGVCINGHAIRRNSDQHLWIRIELQGVYDVDGTWVAAIRGQWLDTLVFRVVIPAETQVGHLVIQRAMLQSLNQGFEIQLRSTPPSPGAVSSWNARPDLVRQHDSTSFFNLPPKPIQPKEPAKPEYIENRMESNRMYTNHLLNMYE